MLAVIQTYTKAFVELLDLILLVVDLLLEFDDLKLEFLGEVSLVLEFAHGFLATNFQVANRSILLSDVVLQLIDFML